MQAAANGDVGQRTGEAATAWLSGPEALAMEVLPSATRILHSGDRMSCPCIGATHVEVIAYTQCKACMHPETAGFAGASG